MSQISPDNIVSKMSTVLPTVLPSLFFLGLETIQPPVTYSSILDGSISIFILKLIFGVSITPSLFNNLCSLLDSNNSGLFLYKSIKVSFGKSCNLKSLSLAYSVPKSCIKKSFSSSVSFNA